MCQYHSDEATDDSDPAESGTLDGGVNWSWEVVEQPLVAVCVETPSDDGVMGRVRLVDDEAKVNGVHGAETGWCCGGVKDHPGGEVVGGGVRVHLVTTVVGVETALRPSDGAKDHLGVVDINSDLSLVDPPYRREDDKPTAAVVVVILCTRWKDSVWEKYCFGVDCAYRPILLHGHLSPYQVVVVDNQRVDRQSAAHHHGQAAVDSQPVNERCCRLE